MALALVLVLVACSGGSGGGSDDRRASPTRPLRTAPLSGRTFWFGDADGSLFEVELDRASVVRSGDRASLVVTGRARNLLTTPGRLRPTASADLGSSSVRATGGVSGEVAGSASEPFRLTAAGVPASLRPTSVTLTFGPASTNQVVVPLGAGAFTADAPLAGVAGTAELDVSPGVTLRLRSSLLYPRYESGRKGQHRLWIATEADAAPVEPAYVPGLHPSLETPDGTVQSIGDQYILDPHTEFVEQAIIEGPIAGRYTLSVLEITTGTTSSATFVVPDR
ncbi:hypothetical protein KSP35_06400 [Aquihabitans sp. G128]|uniref:hypothetical protein n=1 Tax=Aquihabitans sp. G128 TaxID=2849779 RepID=UPI001C223BA2|nr:hypothetical protein [Aquihabitans sp. G128]QXC62428.1 hypothetical protein KSP35_06400 [Aquihabitans sp. G128]